MFFGRSRNIFEPKLYLEIYSFCLHRVPYIFLHANDIANQPRAILTNILLVSRILLLFYLPKSLVK